MTANQKYVAVASGMSLLAAPKFGPGMLLQDDDLDQLGKYTQELSRLMLRSLFGCGVLCGLVVEPKFYCSKLTITITEGLALDCRGDPVHVPKPQTITVDTECDPKFPECLWIVLCGKRKCCAPRPAMCSDDDGESPTVCTRERYAYEIRVARERPDCVCGCPAPACDYECEQHAPRGIDKCKCANPDLCHKHHYAGDCQCGCGEDCDCDCILLAKLHNCGDAENPDWRADHRVRRFVRPVLMEDPQVRRECEEKHAAASKPAGKAENKGGESPTF